MSIVLRYLKGNMTTIDAETGTGVVDRLKLSYALSLLSTLGEDFCHVHPCFMLCISLPSNDYSIEKLLQCDGILHPNTSNSAACHVSLSVSDATVPIDIVAGCLAKK